MQPRLFLTLLFVLQPFLKIWAQEEADSSYFPLALGNTWTYFAFVDPPRAPPDTTFRTSHISESISINDTLYYLAPISTPRAAAGA